MPVAIVHQRPLIQITHSTRARYRISRLLSSTVNRLGFEGRPEPSDAAGLTKGAAEPRVKVNLSLTVDLRAMAAGGLIQLKAPTVTAATLSYGAIPLPLPEHGPSRPRLGRGRWA
jgi:hypothetical protein